MELTRLELALALSAMATFMKQNGYEINLKPSEGLKIAAVITEEVEGLPEEQREREAFKAYQAVIRKIYDGLVNE